MMAVCAGADTVPEALLQMAEVVRQVSRVASEQMPIFLEFWTKAMRDPAIWQAAIGPYRRYQAFFSDLIKAGLKQGALQPVDPEMTGQILVSLAVGLVLQGMLDPEGTDWAEVAEEGMQTLLEGITRRQHRVKVLLTGAFGNVGTSTLQELIKQGHIVRCFDLKTKANEKKARRFKDQVEVMWGDLRRLDDVTAAVQDQEVVIHLAFIIPKLSATGVESETRPDWAQKINVGGTRNLLNAMEALPKPPRIIFASSYHVFGRTQDQPPPRTVADPVHLVEHYSLHKIACEEMVKASDLEWTILRLSATLPLAMKMDPGMFDVPLHNRMEFTHTQDVGLAMANAVSSEEVWGKTLLIGGGPRCQYYYREIAERVLDGLGVGMLPEEAFGSTPFCTDWVDTTESQRLLQYQRRDIENYVQEMVKLMGYRRYLIRMFRPIVRYWLLRKSPYYRRSRSKLPKQVATTS